MRTGRGMAMGPGAARGAAGGRRIALDGRGLTAVPGAVLARNSRSYQSAISS